MIFGNFVQMIYCSTDAIQSVIANPLIKGVSLTGSVNAGKEVAKLAGQYLKKVTLELGGSDPFIICQDANLESVIPVATKARFLNSGQTCISAKRFLVHQTIVEEFATGLQNAVIQLKQGDPLDKVTTLGPLARLDLQENIASQVTESIKQGATCVVGGKCSMSQGYFYDPTILTDVKQGMPVIEEETFGPVAVIIPFETDDEALYRANNSIYGLGASVWTNDTHKKQFFIEGLEVGNIVMNKMVTSMPEYPFGGVKQSGYGRELGIDGLLSFVNIKTVT